MTREEIENAARELKKFVPPGDPADHRYCLRCGYLWESRKDNPRQCPYCKSPKWDKEKSR